jgi:putative endonuclease
VLQYPSLSLKWVVMVMRATDCWAEYVRLQAPVKTERQRIGQAAEDIATDFLRAQGLEILFRNFRRKRGELDVVARDGNVLVVAEVRTRASSAYGGAAASVNLRKQRRLIHAAAQLLQQRPDFARLPVRFDVIVIHNPLSKDPGVDWIKHAFSS